MFKEILFNKIIGRSSPVEIMPHPHFCFDSRCRFWRVFYKRKLIGVIHKNKLSFTGTYNIKLFNQEYIVGRYIIIPSVKKYPLQTKAPDSVITFMKRLGLYVKN